MNKIRRSFAMVPSWATNLSWSALLLVMVGTVAAEAAPFAYVANVMSNSVSVIDVATNTLVATVGVGASPSGVAITPDGSRAYVTNGGSDSASVIDVATNT